MAHLRSLVPKIQQSFRRKLKEKRESEVEEDPREGYEIREKRIRKERRMHLLEIIPAGSLVASIKYMLVNVNFTSEQYL